MIYGIGADIVEVPRMEQALVRHGKRFAERILAPWEWQGFERSAVRPLYLSARFAVKEAFSKALGTGMRAPLTWSSVGVTTDELGKPHLEFAPTISDWLKERGIGACHVTITHERSVACAFVVLERAEIAR